MTRKRFVKLVMSCGHDRNYAHAYAAVAGPAYGSYKKAWERSTDLIAIHTYQMLIHTMAPVFNRLWEQCKGILKLIGPIITPLDRMGLDWGENDDGSYVVGLPEVVAADLQRDEERGATEEQAKNNQTVSR
jgi:hypothetical protein